MIGLLLLTVATQAPAIPKVILSVAEPEEVRIVAGERAVARLTATIKEGFRIQANPASDRFLVPASLDLEADEHVRVGTPEYPPGKPYRLQRRPRATSRSTKETVVIRIPARGGPFPGVGRGERRGRRSKALCGTRPATTSCA